MKKRSKKSSASKPIWLTFIGLLVLSAIVALLLRGKDIILLNQKGLVADEQTRLLITATLVILEITIPTLFLFYYFAWKYRETNDNAVRDSHVTHGKMFSFAIWAFPAVTALLLAIVLVPATHKLQPQKSVITGVEPMQIQVVALRWKWLFIYPGQNIASVNHVQIPVNTPVEFELTADETPMSSFWIPHLGGQLYAMTEHVNRLNLIADTVGDYEGSAAEINGNGFAGMRFNTRVSTQEEFDSWVQESSVSMTLNSEEYKKLLEPSSNHPVAYYSNPDPVIYNTVLSKYAGSHNHAEEGHSSETTEHGSH